LAIRFDPDFEEFRTFADRTSAESFRSWMEFEGVPAHVQSMAQETQFAVFVLKKLAHRARWICAQQPPSEGELEFLATGKLPGQDKE